MVTVLTREGTSESFHQEYTSIDAHNLSLLCKSEHIWVGNDGKIRNGVHAGMYHSATKCNSKKPTASSNITMTTCMWNTITIKIAVAVGC